MINRASYLLYNHDYYASSFEIINILKYVIENIEDGFKNNFDMKFFNWIKDNIGVILFN